MPDNLHLRKYKLLIVKLKLVVPANPPPIIVEDPWIEQEAPAEFVLTDRQRAVLERQAHLNNPELLGERRHNIRRRLDDDDIDGPARNVRRRVYIQ